MKEVSFKNLPTSGGNKCVSVIKGGPTPDWIQLLSEDAKIVDGRGLRGSLINVAEIDNANHLAIGASNDIGTVVRVFSGRGPVPIANERSDVAGVDLIAIGSNPSGGDEGTSFAAPRAAGLAAVAWQAQKAAQQSPNAASIVRLVKGMAKAPQTTRYVIPKEINLECTVTLPAKEVKQPKSRKTKPKAKKSTKAKRSPLAPTPVELQERQQRRREYEKNRNQWPERKQNAREREKNKRQRAKELGLCRTCSQPAISNQTRCPSCAAKHRAGQCDHYSQTASRQK